MNIKSRSARGSSVLAALVLVGLLGLIATVVQYVSPTVAYNSESNLAIVEEIRTPIDPAAPSVTTRPGIQQLVGLPKTPFSDEASLNKPANLKGCNKETGTCPCTQTTMNQTDTINQCLPGCSYEGWSSEQNKKIRAIDTGSGSSFTGARSTKFLANGQDGSRITLKELRTLKEKSKDKCILYTDCEESKGLTNDETKSGEFKFFPNSTGVKNHKCRITKITLTTGDGPTSETPAKNPEDISKAKKIAADMENRNEKAKTEVIKCMKETKSTCDSAKLKQDMKDLYDPRNGSEENKAGNDA